MSHLFCKGWWWMLQSCHTWVYKRMGPQTLQTSLLMLPCARGCKGDLLASYPPAFSYRSVIFHLSFHAVLCWARRGGHGVRGCPWWWRAGAFCCSWMTGQGIQQTVAHSCLLPPLPLSCTFANTLQDR